jgi:hypothetical protein
MDNHNDLDQLAIDYLYGLLDVPNAANDLARLQTPEGKAALKVAERFRAVLSEAAKLQFPEARFTPPTAEVRRNGRVGSLRWVGWVIAATVLGAIAVPGAATFLQARTLAQRAEIAQAAAQKARDEYTQGVEQWKTRVSAASAARQAAMAKYSDLANQYLADVEKAENDVRAKQFNVVVSGPAAITPGAPNYFQVETKNTAGQFTPAILAARVVDQNKRVVYEPPTVETAGSFTLKLPVDLPLTPDRELSLEIDATAKEGAKAELKQKLALAAPFYLAHLTTDKPLYQPGETVRFRALLLDRFKLEPPKDVLAMTLTVLDPSGAELFNRTGVSPKTLAGLACGEYLLPESAPGGEYTIRLREATGRTPEQTRKFLVNKYQPARLEKKLEFTRKSYGPGDEVVAACNAARVSGPLANQPVMASAQVDGIAIPVECAKATDSNGAVLVKFRLPAQIERGAASVTVAFTDGGAQESLVKPVPVVLKKLVVEFYPEGGDLIAGVPNRVYLQARTPLGRPAEMRGRVVDEMGAIVTEVATLSDDVEPGINQGQARFAFTPAVNAKYRLIVDKPEGITSEHMLPAAKPAGVVLNTGSGVTTDRDPLTLSVANVGPSRVLVIGAYARGRLLDHQRLTLAPLQTQTVRLQPALGFGGVTRVTVFEEKGDGPTRQLLPVAERLVFRQPTKKVELNVAPDKIAYTPGEKATVKLSAKDETGRPIPAVAMLRVVNQSVVVMADEKTFRSMPTHFLLTGEVEKAEDLEHVDVLLGNHANAAAALDLLLGVQGWRRFVEQGPEMPPAKHKAAEIIAMAAAPRMEIDSYKTATKAVVDKKRPEFEKAQAELIDANANYESADKEASSGLTEQTKALFEATKLADLIIIDRLRIENQLKEIGIQSLFWLSCLALVIGLVQWAWIAIRGTGNRWVPMGATAVAIALGIVWFCVQPEIPLPASRDALLAHDAAKDQQHPFLFSTSNAIVPLRGDKGPLAKHRDLERAYKDVNSIVAGKEPNAMPAPNAPAAAPPENKRDEKVAVVMAPDAPAEQIIRKGAAGGDAGAGKPSAPMGNAAASAAPAAGGYRRNPMFDAAKKPEIGRIVIDAQDERELERRIDLLRERKPAGRKVKDGDDVLRDLPDLVPDPTTTLPININDRDNIPIDFADRLRGHSLARLMYRPNGSIIRPFMVREYAHIHKPAPDGIREDFAETVFWHPALIVPGEGLSVSFDLSDSVNRYQILAAVHTMDGRLGAAKSELTARKPLTVEPKLPVEVTAGDQIDVPVSVSNETDRPRDVKLTLETPGLVPVGTLPSLNWTQPGNSRSRRMFGFRPAHVEGMARLRLALAGEDAVEMKLPIVPEGFPVQGQISDELRGTVTHTVHLPPTWVPGTLKGEVALFPTPLADLQRGLEGLLQEPGGCFEQTSTTNYPNTLIAEYLRETNQANPEALTRAKGMLDRGYNRLVSFEVPSGNKREGYEWFGHAPAHEALTAYGLLQFRDMARVTDVDPAMIARTRQYLMARRDGQGGFQRSQGALDSFGRASDSVTNAYIVWAITESGKEDDVTKELDRLQKESATNNDPYFLALVANSLLNRERPDAARSLLGRLVKAQHNDGSLSGNSKSITGSQGGPLKIETTALAILGWLKVNQPGEFGPATRNAVKWIGQQRQGQGNFGPTQSTILALKSLIAYARVNKQPPEAGAMTLRLGDKVLANVDYTTDRQDALILEVPSAEQCLKSGDNVMTLTTSGKNTYPYTIGWSYRTLQPPSAQGCAVKLTTQLDRPELGEGESTRLNVTLENVSKQGQGMTVAIVGLPAGLKLPDDFKQLRDLAKVVDGKPGTIGYWELRGRELVLYWRDLAPNAKVDLHLDVIANIPGQYRGPASRAYLYYDPEAKCWAAPLSASIAAK